jgi:predicted ester cyclase
MPQATPLELTKRWFEEIWNLGNVERAYEMTHPETVMADPAIRKGLVHGADIFVEEARALRAAIPDIHVEILETVVQGDRVCVRARVTGTHTGEGLGVRPSGRRIDFTGMVMGRWCDGKLAYGWNSFDLLTLYEQIGALERPRRTAASASRT